MTIYEEIEEKAFYYECTKDMVSYRKVVWLEDIKKIFRIGEKETQK